MSTGADCHFTEARPSQWFYRLQRYPYGETEEYDTFGPFPTFDAAYTHLDRNHANPGGFGISALPGCPHDLLGEIVQWRDRVTQDCKRCGAQLDRTPPPVYGASAS